MVSSAVACGFQADPAKYDTEQTGSGRAWHSTVAYPGFYKKLCCSRQTARRRDAQAPESTTFVDHTIDLLWQNFLNPEFGAKFQSSGYHYFRTYLNFLKTQFRIGQRWLPRQKPALSVKSFRYNTGLWRTDGRTHDDSIYRATGVAN